MLLGSKSDRCTTGCRVFALVIRSVNEDGMLLTAHVLPDDLSQDSSH